VTGDKPLTQSSWLVKRTLSFIYYLITLGISTRPGSIRIYNHPLSKFDSQYILLPLRNKPIRTHKTDNWNDSRQLIKFDPHSQSRSPPPLPKSIGLFLNAGKTKVMRLLVIKPVGKIAEKAVCKSVFLTIWHGILSAELTKTHSFRLLGDFAHWESIGWRSYMHWMVKNWEGWRFSIP